MPKNVKRSGSMLLLVFLVVFVTGRACSREAYRPYGVIGYNYTDRNIAAFDINGFGGGSSAAHQAGGGGGIVCCLDIPRYATTLHIKVVLGLTWDQYDKNLPNETYETDIPVPDLPDKHSGFIEFHFLPERKIEAEWVEFPTTPHIPGAVN